MKGFNSLATALFVASIVSGWDAEERCKNYQDLCLLSFVWCNSEGQCSLPPGVYPWKETSNTAYPMIISSTNYTIKWQAKQKSDVPVTLVWTMDNLTWETNVTGTEFNFNAGEILNSFPTQRWPNARAADAWYAASHSLLNSISIRRANANLSGDYSDQFIVQPSIVEDYLERQVEIEYNKWKFGVGLGVGLGVPFLLAITALVTWLVCKKTMKRPEGKPVEMTPQ